MELVVLNSRAVSAAQTRWLRETLARPASVPRVVVLTSPPFSCGGHTGSEALRRAWLPMLKRYGVRLVLSGGSGGYERFVTGGLTYVVAGSASAPSRGSCSRSYPRRRVVKSGKSFVHLMVDARGVQARVLSDSGKTIDRFRTG